MKDRPDEPGIWTREGKFYRVWKISAGLRYEKFDENFKTEICNSPVDSLPAGSWQKLTAPLTTAEADKQFRDWLTSSGACPCHVHRKMDIADKAAELFAGVEREPASEIEFNDAWLKRHGLEWDDEAEEWNCFLPATGGKIYPLRYNDGQWFIGRTALFDDPDDPDEPDQIAGLKAIIARQDEEIRELKENVERRTNELDAHVRYHEHCRNKIDKTLGEPRYDDCDIWAAFVKRIAELKDFTPVAPQPEVIEGKGQAVTSELAGEYLREEPHGKVYLTRMSAETGNVFHDGYRYLRCPAFPPRAAFVAPPKPELVQKLIRFPDGESVWVIPVEWCGKSGVLHKDTLRYWWTKDYELLDPATGEPIAQEPASE